LNEIKYSQSSAVTAAPRNIRFNLHAPEPRIYSNVAGGSWQNPYPGGWRQPWVLWYAAPSGLPVLAVAGLRYRIEVETDYPDYPDYQPIL
jgi:hypothetical protein